MLVLPAMTMQLLMTEIVEATHSLHNEHGDPEHVGTIDPKMLKMAAITALQIATGQPIWPGDVRIRLKATKFRHGIFEEE